MSVVVHYLMASVPEGRSLGIEVVAVELEGLARRRRRVEHYSGVEIEALGFVILLELVRHGTLLSQETCYLEGHLRGLAYNIDLELAGERGLVLGIHRHNHAVAGFDVHHIEWGEAAKLTPLEGIRNLGEP